MRYRRFTIGDEILYINRMGSNKVGIILVEIPIYKKLNRNQDKKNEIWFYNYDVKFDNIIMEIPSYRMEHTKCQKRKNKIHKLL